MRSWQRSIYHDAALAVSLNDVRVNEVPSKQLAKRMRSYLHKLSHNSTEKSKTLDAICGTGYLRVTEDTPTECAPLRHRKRRSENEKNTPQPLPNSQVNGNELFIEGTCNSNDHVDAYIHFQTRENARRFHARENARRIPSLQATKRRRNTSVTSEWSVGSSSSELQVLAARNRMTSRKNRAHRRMIRLFNLAPQKSDLKMPRGSA